MIIHQRQQEIKIYINDVLAPISNAPELVFGNRTSRSVRRNSDGGQVIKHKLNKLEEGFEFQLSLDYDPDAIGAAAALSNAIANDDGVAVRIFQNDESFNTKKIAGVGPGVHTSSKGIAIDGDDLYVLVQFKIYRVNRHTGIRVGVNPVLTLDIDTIGNPTGIAVNDDALWIVDVGGARIYEYQISTSALRNDYALDAANTTPSGLWIDRVRGVIFVANEADNTIYAYNSSDFSRRANDDITTPRPNNDNSNLITGIMGINSGGVNGGSVIWAVFSDNTYRAYRVLNRVVTELFNNAFNNPQLLSVGNPARIALIGNTIYILDDHTDTIHRASLATGNLLGHTCFTALIPNAPTVSTDPSDAEAVESITYTLRINSDVV